ncbi:Crp/Fnr family transcriptional regulator [Flavobacterium sp. H122]|uniref:Crp/Fnr family transcriptional regulator n=1 Tax=Flavobacterium sp. H122 TaxID=2529860 RepID=UPI0010AA9459|nr:Crp/Fnr family transcriptional regulator [Flavobacterium sp. H122]
MNFEEQLYKLFSEHDLFEKAIKLKRNELLKEENSIDTNIYYIKDGSLKVSVFINDDEQIIRFGYQNNFVVALDSFLTHKPSKLYIQAIKQCEVLVIPKLLFTQFIEKDVTHLKLWNAILENLITQQMEREIDLLTASSKERYLRVLNRSPKVFQKIPHGLIASYLRMSPETLSRLKKS